ncbi:hypothetical protein LOZ80_14840 [Paenibacillus sp. HWE-109]|uniref:hypothetical protein n=1 Tax=Paenibacillus sp. HWE-109 TaxID=1306526 RepID=UPI001EDFEAE0|nr:hypothetical protein [Paenibacillus sp. HWE-109]UKS30137.1 hypothetical protein LOZ80_14840 [Paenibacillus sp. HWE-109]
MRLKGVLFCLIVVAIIALTGCNQNQPITSPSGGGFTAFKKEFDKRTSVQQTEYFSTLKGTEVTWSGTVQNAFVAESENKARHVVIHVGSAADYASFTLSASDKTDITKLNKGDAITIKGTLVEQGGIVTSWLLNDATVVK